MNEDFLKQTAEEYGLNFYRVRFIAVNFPDEFYEKLEEELELLQAVHRKLDSKGEL